MEGEGGVPLGATPSLGVGVVAGAAFGVSGLCDLIESSAGAFHLPDPT